MRIALLLFIIISVHCNDAVVNTKMNQDILGRIIYGLIASVEVDERNLVISQMLFSNGVVELRDGTAIPSAAIAFVVIEEIFGPKIVDESHSKTVEIVGASVNGFRYRYAIPVPNPGEVDRVRAKMRLGLAKNGFVFP